MINVKVYCIFFELLFTVISGQELRMNNASDNISIDMK